MAREMRMKDVLSVFPSGETCGFLILMKTLEDLRTEIVHKLHELVADLQTADWMTAEEAVELSRAHQVLAALELDLAYDPDDEEDDEEDDDEEDGEEVRG